MEVFCVKNVYMGRLSKNLLFFSGFHLHLNIFQYEGPVGKQSEDVMILVCTPKIIK